MKKKFGIEMMDDFSLHVPPQPEIIAQYTQLGQDGGPDKENLQIDMRGKISSTWNQRVIEILVEAATEFRNNNDEFKKLPVRPPQYMQKLFKNQIERAKTAFTIGQQQFKTNGEVESLEEVEQRNLDRREKVAKDMRVNARRSSVS